ncbi:MAG: glycoside hydrolase family 127 protein [Bacteroidota bacterium]|nr:glycoside hydrolase family 127 protein [Bacteroidota bacterium]
MNIFFLRKSVNYFLLIAILLGNVFFVQAQTLPLPTIWKFKIGDNPEWSNASFNDSLWDTKTIQISWSAKDLKANVFAWYRTTIIIPSSMKNAIEKGNGLKLSLGKIDDVDFTYFNGKLIGQMGSLPPNYITKWDVQRVYSISPSDVHYDKENVIAVRLFSPDVGGIGMYEGPYTYGPIQWSDFVSMTQTISETMNNVFTSKIIFSHKGNKPYKGTLEYFVNNKSGNELHKELKEVQLFPDSETVVIFPEFQPGKEDFLIIGYRFTESESKSIVTKEQLYLANKLIDIAMADEPKPVVQNKSSDVYSSVSFNNQRLSGYLEKRMVQNLVERLLKVDEHGLIGSYLQRPGIHPWAGEHVGKYLETASNVWKYSHDVRLKKQMDRLMFTLINTQLEDGYLGTYIPSEYWTSWDVWSHKYNLYGLLGYYTVTGYQPALETCKRIGDLLCKTFGNNPRQRNIIDAGTHIGMAATSVLDPMVMLYRYTGDKKYLDFCYYITEAYEQKNGPKVISSIMETGQVNKVANGKAYEMLSNYVGLVNLYKVTGDEKFLTPAVRAWEDVVSKRLYITGSTSAWEHFQADDVLPGADKDHIGEGCVTVTWLQLNQALLEVTGELRFAEQIEKSIYNHLLGAENPQDGCVSYYTPLMDKKPFIGWISCCTSSIPRGIAMIPYFTFGNVKEIPTLMLYEPASYTETITTTDKKQINLSLQVSGSFPEKGDITVTVHTSQTAAFPIALRVPSWCSSFTAKVGGKEFKGTPNQYLTIARKWKSNDKIKISFDMPLQTLSGGKSYPDQIAFQRGPQVLAFDKSFSPELLKDSTSQRFNVDHSQFKYAPKLLPKEWIGNQSYSVPIKIGEADSLSNKLILVPYADASQTGGVVQVWLPLNVIDNQGKK